MIEIDLSKQKALDTDPKAIQQIGFTESLTQQATYKTFFIIEKAKEKALDFPEGMVKAFWFYILLQYKTTQYNMLNVKLSIRNLINQS